MIVARKGRRKIYWYGEHPSARFEIGYAWLLLRIFDEDVSIATIVSHAW